MRNKASQEGQVALVVNAYSDSEHESDIHWVTISLRESKMPAIRCFSDIKSG